MSMSKVRIEFDKDRPAPSQCKLFVGDRQIGCVQGVRVKATIDLTRFEVLISNHEELPGCSDRFRTSCVEIYGLLFENGFREVPFSWLSKLVSRHARVTRRFRFVKVLE